MSRQTNWKDFLYFSRNQRIALCLLLCVLLPLFLLARYWWEGRSLRTMQLAVQIDSLPTFADGRANSKYSYQSDQQGISRRSREISASFITPFPFDPNTADEATLRRLGLSNHAVRSLLAYRAKGGVLRSVEKFASIYGVTPTAYEQLAPYIRISPTHSRTSSAYAPLSSETRSALGSASHSMANATTRLMPGAATNSYASFPVKYPSGTVLDLNDADTTELKRLPGIGTWRARSIVRYRDRLGGFVSIAQLREIENLPDSLLRNFRIALPARPSLHFNSMSVRELVAHPYLTYAQAVVIVEHRRKRGNLTTLTPLRMYEEFSDADLARLAPYVQF